MVSGWWNPNIHLPVVTKARVSYLKWAMSQCHISHLLGRITYIYRNIGYKENLYEIDSQEYSDPPQKLTNKIPIFESQ